MLVVEDLHWADPTTREVLEGLVRQIESGESQRLLVLATSRDWAPTGASVVKLPALSDDEVAEMVDHRMPEGEPASEEVVRQVVSRSDGVPLFVEEVAHMIVGALKAGDRSLAERAIPDTVEALLQARLDSLGSGACEATHVAAAIGREFDFELLRSATRHGDRALRDELEELIAAGMVVTRLRAGEERYAFRHALIREVAWRAMPRDDRASCHSRIAVYLERERPSFAQEYPELIAHHLSHGGLHARAAEQWNVAGRRALARAAYAESIARLQKGLDDARALGDSREALHLEMALRESLGMAYYSTLGYGHPSVEETFTHLESLSDELGEEVSFETLYGIWGVRFMLGRVEETAVLVEQFRARADDESEPMAKLYAHGCAGLRAAMMGELAQADMELARSTDECEIYAESIHLDRLPYGGAVHPPAWWAWVCLMRGSPRRARDAMARMLAVARRLENAYGDAVAGHFESLFATELDDVEGARKAAERQIAFSDEQHILLWKLCSQCIHGWAVARSGEPEAGLAELDACLALLGGIGMRTASSTFYALRAEAELLAGQAARALATSREGLALAETSLDRYYVSPLKRFTARAHLALGDRAEAEAAYREAIDLARRGGAGWYELRAGTELAELMEEEGRPEEARAVIVPISQRFDREEASPPIVRARLLVERLG